MVEPKPFVKWAGGKQALADTLRGHFPKHFDCWYEPFLGGASVFFAVAPARSLLADQNEWLVQTYRAVRDDWKLVARVLDRLPNTKDDYLRIRSIPPDGLDRAERAAHFIYLNKTGFRGLFRVNRRGQFNVPYGAYDRRYYDAANLERSAKALQRATLRAGDFERCVDGAEADDFIYFDPPYYKLGGHSDFNRYTRSQFKAGDHERLAALCRRLDRAGVRFALSNSDTPFVQQLFEGFRFHAISARREIQLDPRKRDVSELLITNY